MALAREATPGGSQATRTVGRRQEIDHLDHEADRIKNEIRSRLPTWMFLAVDRRDMLEILDFQDSIADVARDIAELADDRGMATPADLVEPFWMIDELGRIESETDELEERVQRRLFAIEDELCGIEGEVEDPVSHAQAGPV